jgi:hypothetical protein
MTRRRKKEEEEWERLSAGHGGNGREEEEIIKKSSVLGCRIVLYIFFFLYVRCQFVIGGQKTPPLHTDRKEVIPV